MISVMKRRTTLALIVLVLLPTASLSEARGTERTEPGMVHVPKLVGMLREKAEHRLRYRGLKPDVVPAGQGDSRTDRVLRQHPHKGKAVQAGSHVKIWCDCYPAPCPSPPPGREIYDPCSCATRTND
jgi:hypothetical protein